jgi:toxin ParE1/3/4
MADQRYVLSAEAVRDILSIEEFIRQRDGGARALRVIARLHRAMLSLSTYPGMGRRRESLADAPLSYAVQSWIIFYRAAQGRQHIEIVRVIDGRRDVDALLGRSPPE